MDEPIAYYTEWSKSERQKKENLKPGLCNNLKGWDGMGDGREVQEGGDICILITGSCWCMAETNTIL